MLHHPLPARTSRRSVFPYIVAAVAAVLALGSEASAQSQSRSHARSATIVRLTSLGLETPTADSVRVQVWAAGPARVGVGNAEPTAIADTLRLSALSSLTVDVTQADVHVRLLSPGRMRLGGEVSGGRAIRFTATGRHIVILKGGVGADTVTEP